MHPLVDFVHAGAAGVNVAMRALPDAVLVVENVVLQPTRIGHPPLARQMLHPLGLYCGAVGHVGDVGVGACNKTSIGVLTVSAIGLVGINRLLGRECACGIAA